VDARIFCLRQPPSVFSFKKVPGYGVALRRMKCSTREISAKTRSKWIIAEATRKIRKPPSQNTTSIAKSTMNIGELLIPIPPFRATLAEIAAALHDFTTRILLVNGARAHMRNP
jgi:hypothetical protein